MKIDEMPSAIERIWDFVVPPILEVLSAALIVILIVGTAPLRSLSILLIPYINTLKDPEVINFLSAYGIIKLTPLILLFILLLLAYAFHKIAPSIGRLLPITLVWNHHGMMARRVSPSWVADVWQYYPNITNVSDLHRIIEERLERAKLQNDPLFSTAIFYERCFNKLFEHLDFLQFLMIHAAFTTGFGIIWTSLNGRSVLLNGLGVILFLLVIYALLVWQQFKHLGQLELWRVVNFRTSLQAQIPGLVQPDDQKRLSLKKICEDEFKDEKKDKIIIPCYKWR